MALTDTAIRGTKPSQRPFKIYDREGLFLLVNPGGSMPRRASTPKRLFPDITISANLAVRNLPPKADNLRLATGQILASASKLK
jgi:hypothetical protein